MNSIITLFKKNIDFSNFWIKNGFILVILSIVINHLTKPENFPLNKSYKFPWLPIFISFLLGSLIIIIARFNFLYFKKKYSSKKINLQVSLHFLFSTLGYISIIYISLYYVLNGLVNGTEVVYSLYHLLSGLSVTLLLSTIIIVIIFSTDFYKLYKFTSINEKLKVKQSGKITLVNFIEISFIYSENKIVYIVKIDGTSIVTDFKTNRKSKVASTA